MCFGGPKPPPPPDYAAQARSQMMIMQEQARIAEEQRAAQEYRANMQKEVDTHRFNEGFSSAKTGARENALSDLAARGHDPSGLEHYIERILGSISGQVPHLDPNPQSYFSNQNFADLILGRATDDYRAKYTNQVNNMFTPDFANQRVQSTMDDDIINRILGEQYDPALQQVQRAFERGTVNQQGFDTALNMLNNQKSTANANLQQTGGGLLSSLRDQLSGVGNEARNAASNFQYGMTFDPNSYQSRADSLFNEGVSGLEGNLRNAVGGQQFFDIGSILNQGRTAQGTAGTNENRALFDAFNKNEQDRNKQRGLGSQGVF